MSEWSTDRLDPATRVPVARDQQEQLAWERRPRRRPKPPVPEDTSEEQDEGAPDHQIDDLA